MTQPFYPCRWHSSVLHEISTLTIPDLQILGFNESDHEVHVLRRMRALMGALVKICGPDSDKRMSQDLNSARNEVQYHILALSDSTFRVAFVVV